MPISRLRPPLGRCTRQVGSRLFQCGANVVMPNLTPTGYRKHISYTPTRSVKVKTPFNAEPVWQA